MAFAYTRLCDTGYIAGAAAAHITNASGKTTYVRVMTIHNTHTAALAVTMYRVPDNAGAVGTASAANQVWKQTVQPDETITVELAAPGWVLSDTNDTVQLVCGTASKVTFSADGGVE